MHTYTDLQKLPVIYFNGNFDFSFCMLKYCFDSDDIMSLCSKMNVLKKSSFNLIIHMLNTVLLGRQHQELNGYFSVNNGNNF